jgi:hypothetical protein
MIYILFYVRSIQVSTAITANQGHRRNLKVNSERRMPYPEAAWSGEKLLEGTPGAAAGSKQKFRTDNMIVLSISHKA